MDDDTPNDQGETVEPAVVAVEDTEATVVAVGATVVAVEVQRSALEGRSGAVVFGAAWAPAWRVLKTALGGEAGVWFEDVDENPAGADRLAIRVVPTVIVVDDGREQRRCTGAVAADQVRNWVRHVREGADRAR